MQTSKVATYSRDKWLLVRMWLTSFGFLALYVAFGFLLWQYAGLSWYFIIPIIGFFSFLQWWFSDSILLGSAGAKEVKKEDNPKLHKLVDDLAGRVGIKSPKIAIIDTDVPNAFATGRSKNRATVAVTRGILSILNDEELEAVLGHEIGHIMNRDVTVLAFANFLVAVTGFLMSMFFWTSLFGGVSGRSNSNGNSNSGGIWVIYLVTLVVYVLGQVFVMLIARSREYVADHTGAELTGNPKALASALEKMSVPRKPKKEDVEKLQPSEALCIVGFSSGISGLFATHPPVKERIKRLNEMSEEIQPINAKKATYKYKYVKYNTYDWKKG